MQMLLYVTLPADTKQTRLYFVSCNSDQQVKGKGKLINSKLQQK